ncbi:LOW QUALITY PROTEIN: hydroxyacylglutathione hydrolase-like protein [Glossophaga mutica]
MYLVIKEHMQKAVAKDMTVPKRAQSTFSHLSYFLWEDKCPRPAYPLLQYSCPAPTCPSFSDPSSSNWHLESTAQQMYQNLAETLGTLPQDTERPVPSPLLGSSLLAQPTGCAPNLCQECGMNSCQPGGQGRLGVVMGAQEGVGDWGRAWTGQPGLPGALRQGYNKDLQLYPKRGGDDMPTVPSTPREELLYNPFLRVVEEPASKCTGKVAPAEVLEVLCREQVGFDEQAEPLQPQFQALLAMQTLGWR